jgi:FkbM family methyltransferase
MILKDVKFFIKKIFLSEQYQLKKRIIRSINKPLEEEMQIVQELCSTDKISLDVGVFRGVYSYLLSKHSLKVVGFEANPIMFKYLDRNLTSIIKNLKLYNLALSNHEGDVELKIPLRKKSFFKVNFEDYYECGLATIDKENDLDSKEIHIFNIKKARLDSFQFNNKVGFIKIDVEGHEQKVLEGSVKILENNQPNLLVEIEKRYRKLNPDYLISFLREIGYQCFVFDEAKLIEVKTYKDFPLKNNFIFKKI